MLKTFRDSFRLRIAYKTNSVIFSLKTLPLIKRLLPEKLYASKGLKTFASVISILSEIMSVFMGKLIYIAAMIFPVSMFLADDTGAAFLHVFFFLTFIGGLLNTDLLDPSMDKYYAIFSMRMDPAKYTLANYGFFLFKTIVGFLPFTLIFGLISGVDVIACLLLPLYVVAVKLIFGAFQLLYMKPRKDGTVKEIRPLFRFISAAVCLVAAYLPPLLLGTAISKPLFYILFAVFALAGIAGYICILRFKSYRALYRVILNPETIAALNTTENNINQQSMTKTISEVEVTSSKTGWKYFNELFVKRHSKLLSRPAKTTTIVCAVILVIAVAASLFSTEVSETINELLLNSLPYFLFIMYIINKGAVISQAMFMNCDHSMLSYRFFRQPKAILALFTERLKYITMINLMPASVIAVGLPLLLFITGGTDQPLNYLLSFSAIISMSVFFSVHNLVLYYLFQPYNFNMEIKGAAYRVVNALTYMICYFGLQVQLPTFWFCLAVTIFCVIYVIIALILAYTIAPKTFKLHK